MGNQASTGARDSARRDGDSGPPPPADDVAATLEARTRELEACQAQLFAIADSLPAQVAYIDATGRYRFVNRTCAEWLGLPREDIVGKRVKDVWGRDPFKQFGARLKAGLSGEVVAAEEEVTFPDGVTRFVRSTATPQTDGEGRVQSLVVQVEDITESKRAEEDLRRSEEQYRVLVETMNDGLGVIDADGAITYVNDSACTMFGYGRDEIVGRKVVDLLLPDRADREYFRQQMRALREGDSTPYEIDFTRKDGSRVSTITAPRQMRDPAGNPVGSFAVMTDVTEIKRAERELRAGQARLQEAIDALSEGFLYFDKDERLIASNRTYREYYLPIADKLVPGTKFEDWARIVAESGMVTDAIGDEDAWVAERLAVFRDPPGPMDYELTDGRWIQIQEYKTPSGGTAGMRADVTERKRTELALRASQANLAEAQRLARIGSWHRDLNVDVLTWSDEMHRILGIAPGEEHVNFDAYLDAIHPDDRDAVKEIAVALRDKPGRYSVDHRVILPTGETRVCHMQGTTVLDKDGAPIAIHGTVQDITESRQAEDRLRETTATLEAIFRSSPISIVTVDLEGSVQTWNPAAEAMFGWSEAEVVGRPLPTLGEAHQEEFRASVEHARTAGTAYSAETQRLCKDGTVLDVSLSAAPLRDESGEVVGLIGMTQDITERKRAERALRDSEAGLRNAQRIARLGSWERDLKTGTLRWSDEHYRIFGLDSGEGTATAELFLERVHAEDRERVLQAIDESRKTGNPYSLDYRILLQNGECRHLHSEAEIAADETGSPRWMRGSVQDVTERYLADEQLRLHAQILDQTHDSVVSTNRDGIVTTWNRGAERLLGYTADEAVGRHISFVYTEDQQDFLRTQVIAPTEAKGWHEVEVRLRRKSGEEFFANLTDSVLRDADGNVVGRIGLAVDITERKRAEAALRESEAYLAHAERIAHLGTWVSRADGQDLRWSDEHFRILGLKPQQSTPSRELFLSMVHPDDRERLIRLIEDMQRHRKSYVTDFRVLRADGQVRHVHAEGIFIENESEETAHRTGFIQDVTERTLAEERLRESEARLASAERIACVGSWDTAPDGETLRWSDGHFRIFGLDPRQSEPSPQLFASVVHPDDRRRVGDLIQGTRRDGKPYTVDFRIVRPDGEVRHIHAEGFWAKDKKGHAVRGAGFLQDVTERALAEESLAQTTQTLDAIIRSSPVAISLIDLEGRVMKWNPAAEEVFGWREQEVLGKLNPIVPRSAREEYAGHLKTVAGGNSIRAKEIMRRRKAGPMIDVLLWTAPVRDAAGQVVAAVALYEDITERKRAAEQLRETSEILEAIVRASPIAINTIDLKGRVQTWNPASEAVFGWKKEEVVGKPLPQIPDGEEQEYRKGLARVRRGEITAGQELIRVRKDGAAVDVSLFGAPLRDGKGRIVGAVGLYEDITERKRAAEQLRETSEALEAVFQASPIAINTIDADGRVQKWNPAAEAVFGWTAKEVVGKPLPTIPDDGEEEHRGIVAKVRKGEIVSGREVVRLRKDGTLVDVNLSVGPLRDGKDRIVGAIGLYEDITERKRIERALRESEARLNGFFAAAPNGMVVFDSDLRYAKINDALARINGLSPEEHIGKTVPEVVPDISEEYMAGYRHVLKTGESILGRELVAEVPSAPGQNRIFLTDSFAIAGPDGKAAGIGIIVNDITGIRRAEAELREKEAGLARAQHLARLGSWRRDLATGEVTWSDEMFRLIGLEPGTVPATFGLYLDAVHPDDRQSFDELSAAFRKDPKPYSIDHRILLPGGEERICSLSGEVTYGEDGTPVAIHGTVQDITERKRAEEALRESEASLAESQRIAHVGSWSIRIGAGRIEWSDEHYRIFGVEPGQVEPSHEFILGMVHADDREDVARKIASAQRDAKPYSMECRLVRPDGEVRHVYIEGTRAEGGAGRPLRRSGIIQDITARKLAEDALRESEAGLAEAQRTAHVGSWEAMDETGELRWSDEHFRIVGLEPQECEPTQDLYLSLIHPDDRAFVKKQMAKARKEGGAYGFDHRIVRPDGEVRYVRAEGAAVEGGTAHRFERSGTIQDITERRLAEDALRESEARLNGFFGAAPSGLVIFDKDIRYVRVNESMARMNGLSAEDHIGKRLRDVVPDIAEHSEPTYRRILKTGQPGLSNEITSDSPANPGETRTWLVNNFPIPGADGKTVAVGSVVNDITERKRAEAEVRTLNAELEQRVEERTAELRAAQDELVRKERLATLGQLTGTVSHELRNPLGVLRASLEFFDERTRGKELGVERGLDRMARTITRCDRIIEEMLDYARIGGLDPAPARIDDWLADTLDELAVPGGITVRRKLSAPDAAPAFDSEQLRRAVINVYDNACQALVGRGLAEGQRAGATLKVATASSSGRLQIIIEDNGPGMPPDVLEKALEPLFSTKGFGVGLGLPTVKQIMEQHRGGIEIASTQGKGTRVVLWLPLEPDGN